MTGLTIPRPEADEAATFYHGYIAKVTGDNIGEQLQRQLEVLEQLMKSLDDEAALFRYEPGKWSIKEIVGHLTDAERIFAYRLMRIARADTTPLPGFDENAFVAAGGFDERPLSTLLREFRAVRVSTVALLEGLPATGWLRKGVASGHAISTRALAYIMVGHVTHHLGVLRERYGLGARPGRVST
ncbi:MAG TPA: DinB family protein [Gemmatimonadales bacterium]|nr:DinB family protein [Gemmatimonadales bacterium]